MRRTPTGGRARSIRSQAASKPSSTTTRHAAGVSRSRMWQATATERLGCDRPWSGRSATNCKRHFRSTWPARSVMGLTSTPIILPPLSRPCRRSSGCAPSRNWPTRPRTTCLETPPTAEGQGCRLIAGVRAGVPCAQARRRASVPGPSRHAIARPRTAHRRGAEQVLCSSFPRWRTRWCSRWRALVRGSRWIA